VHEENQVFDTVRVIDTVWPNLGGSVWGL
jgi:hypothetical protein